MTLRCEYSSKEEITYTFYSRSPTTNENSVKQGATIYPPSAAFKTDSTTVHPPSTIFDTYFPTIRLPDVEQIIDLSSTKSPTEDPGTIMESPTEKQSSSVNERDIIRDMIRKAGEVNETGSKRDKNITFLAWMVSVNTYEIETPPAGETEYGCIVARGDHHSAPSQYTSLVVNGEYRVLSISRAFCREYASSSNSRLRLMSHLPHHHT